MCTCGALHSSVIRVVIRNLLVKIPTKQHVSNFMLILKRSDIQDKQCKDAYFLLTVYFPFVYNLKCFHRLFRMDIFILLKLCVLKVVTSFLF